MVVQAVVYTLLNSIAFNVILPIWSVILAITGQL